MWVLAAFLAFFSWTIQASVVPQVVPGGQLFRPDYTYNRQAGGWLKFYPIPESNHEAALRCLREGAILASPLDDGISDALMNIMGSHGITNAPIHTGISDEYAAGEFESVEGVPLTDMCLTWPTEPLVECPDNIPTCIAMHINGSAVATCCSERHAFVCYRQKGVSKLNKCGTVDLGYELSTKTNSCYKASVGKLTWPDAHKACAKDGAHLAIINSDSEAKVLMELRDTNYKEEDKTVLVGALVVDGPRQYWITVKGQTINEAGYFKWASGEPNNILEKEDCVAISKAAKITEMDKGILNDVSCTSTHYFICEIDSTTNSSQK